MFSVFDFLYRDLKKYKQLQKDLEKKADSTDIDSINWIRTKMKDYKEQLDLMYEVYFGIIVIGFFFALLVNEIYNLPINIDSCFSAILVFINLVIFFLLLNEIMNLVNKYNYNKTIIFSSIMLISLINGLYVTLHDSSLHRCDLFYIIVYLAIGLVFTVFMIEITKLYDLSSEIFGYKAPKSKIDSLSNV